MPYYQAVIYEDNTLNNIEGGIIVQTDIKPALNQILYGPPGTGKTYNTVIKAMGIINGKEYEYSHKDNGEYIYKDKEGNAVTYSSLQNEFKTELEKKSDDSSKRIEFITFHQSYSYEEFVEGIKPDLSTDNLKYELKAGTFKKICEHANTKFSDNFDEVYEKFLEEINTANDLFKLTTRKNQRAFGLDVNGNNNLNTYMGKNFNKQGTITKESLKKHFWQTRTQTAWSGYYDGIIDYLKKKYKLVKTNKRPQTYVLIIDEINRGNISKIFGELITLIEEDKRENVTGEDKEYNTLKVTLPYSGDTFSVPNNLYIIGTMNTSDRSIASVDIALRRRFKFKEMMPDETVFDDFSVTEKLKLSQIFNTLNRRICSLLDRDHQIGHSYFIGANKDNLKDIWFDCIMPLLNEYFYGDWEKLKAILGEAEEENESKQNTFIKYISINDKFFATSKNDIFDDDKYYEFSPKDKTDFLSALEHAFSDKETQNISDVIKAEEADK